ncbi:MAG: hypothetical protein EXS35_05365 [Pedosphaera sp.]|nr:hypothetical protein [Pedosphaera sp.]
MPTFGDYHSSGEPVAITDERGHISTVWRAQKGDGREYAIKVFSARRRGGVRAESPDALARDRGLEFLAGIKDLKKAQAEGGACLSPVHDFGIADEGAWYATDFYSRSNLKAWITRRGGVDSAGLRNVVAHLAAGCLALKQSRGYSHGNLKVSNAFRVGTKGKFHQTPILLTDPFPAGPAHELDNPNLELLAGTMEAQDLRGIGEIILQLVESRLLTSSEDYNWPIAPTPAWKALGKDGDRWLKLCNQLLNANRAADAVTLESLAKEHTLAGGGGKLLLILTVVGVVCLVGGGAYALKVQSSKRNEANFQADLTAAKQALGVTNLFEAQGKIKSALARKPGDKDAVAVESEIEAHINREFNNAVQSADAKLTSEKLDEAEKFLEVAEKWKPNQPSVAGMRKQISDLREKEKLKVTAAAKRGEMERLLSAGDVAISKSLWDEARTDFDKALPLAAELEDQAAKTRAQEGSKRAADMLNARSAEDRMRAEADGLVASARAAALTNGWTEATDFLNRSLTVATTLKDSERINTANNELRAAKTSQAKYLSEKKSRDEFVDWMTRGKAAADLTTATNLFKRALDRAVELKDTGYQAQAREALREAEANLIASAQKDQAAKNYRSYMSLGAAAAQTNGWSDAITQFNKAAGIAKGLQDQEQVAKAEAELSKAQAGLENWNKLQSSVKQLTGLIAQAGQAEVAKLWDSASNYFNQALALAGQLNDGRAKDARAGLDRAVAAMKLQAQEKQWQAEAQALVGQGKAAAATNGWSAAKDFFAQAMRLAEKLPERTLLSQADAEYTKAVAQLNAEITAQQKQAAYTGAMAEAKKKLDAREYQLAMDQADKALASKPGDLDAEKLKADAKQKLDVQIAAETRKRQFDTAMTEGNAAYTRREYPVAAEKAREALALQPDDAGAKTLQRNAKAGLDAQAEDSKAYKDFNDRLANLMKQFSVKKQGATVLPENSAEAPFAKVFLPTLDQFQAESKYLRAGFTAKGWLDAERKKCLDELDKIMKYWNTQ